MRRWKIFIGLIICLSFHLGLRSQIPSLRTAWTQPSEMSKPWTFWYWMYGAVSKEGITADLKSMKEAGIAGAYLMPIKGPADPPHIPSPVVQLSKEWWNMIRFTFSEASRFGIKLGFHVSDGFALAGGPWITPELSMQKLTWSITHINGGQDINLSLPQPEMLEGYYKDIGIYAYPTPDGGNLSTQSVKPKITGSKPDSVLQLLVQQGNKKNFTSEEPCWIQYEFDQPFLCRSIVIHSRTNYQSNRLTIQWSNDGKNFTTIKQLVSARHGWQDWDSDYTHSIPATKAKYFRFVYNREGSEPGAEDLDAAKWKQSLKIYGIELLSEARIDQYEGKNGEVWRISRKADSTLIPEADCVPFKNIINLSPNLSADGKLLWKAPPGNWTIIRMGHTSTGHRNETAGGGKGLECDKFNPEAVKLQFNKWFGEIYNQVDPALVKNILQYLHIDSWECGSQNWSVEFANEFRKRRGYDLLPYLPVMAGIPVETVDRSEKILRDVRETIAELVNDKFYQTLSLLAKEKNLGMSAESVAPTMVSDGMLHYKTADFPMGEFWLRSPTHDKPNDMLDAISGAHIYGKNIVQSESFTELRMAWDEYPGMLKTLLDRNFAMGMNRVFFHVFTHNPWLDKKPGMTLDPIGLFFQRDQTWWNQVSGFTNYIQRCQALLQLGKPVTDIAVFTGENFPRRSILPDRLTEIIPGIIGKKRLASEKIRLANIGLPMRQIPAGVNHSANLADPEDWVDPLNGYAYDSYNKDALLSLTSVKNKKISLSTGASYNLLIIPGALAMSPDKNDLSEESILKISQLVKKGATVLLPPENALIKKLIGTEKPAFSKMSFAELGKGKLIFGPWEQNNFDSYGFQKDFIVKEKDSAAEGIAWTHRKGEEFDIYFISNQQEMARHLEISLRVDGRLPEIWNPVDGTIMEARTYSLIKERTLLPVFLEKNASVFIVLKKPVSKSVVARKGSNEIHFKSLQTIKSTWIVSFNPLLGGPAKPIEWKNLQDWSQSTDSSISYYSGEVQYQTTFYNPANNKKNIWLNLNKVANIAEVFVNGKSCGIAWTSPFRVNITDALKPGLNELKITVVNTWANRLIGDYKLPPEKRVTNTAYPFSFSNRPLLPAGLLGPVIIESAN